MKKLTILAALLAALSTAQADHKYFPPMPTAHLTSHLILSQCSPTQPSMTINFNGGGNVTATGYSGTFNDTWAAPMPWMTDMLPSNHPSGYHNVNPPWALPHGGNWAAIATITSGDPTKVEKYVGTWDHYVRPVNSSQWAIRLVAGQPNGTYTFVMHLEIWSYDLSAKQTEADYTIGLRKC
jgi:hypothetical protein